MNWFSIRSVLKADRSETDGRAVFEERIILVRERDADLAIKKAEKQFEKYAADLGLQVIGGFQSYMLSEEEILDGAEVFSLLRTSNLEEDVYYSTFFDTGNEKTDSVQEN